MLRYKNSLLERILLEKGKTFFHCPSSHLQKEPWSIRPLRRNCINWSHQLEPPLTLTPGIDVQAELRLKTGAPGAQPKTTPMPPKPAPGPGAGPRPAQRHPGIASKPDAFGMPQRDAAYAVPSPQFQATPTSHVSSPSHTKSPGFGFQGGMSPVTVEQQGTGRPQLLPQPRAFNNQTSPPAISMPQTDPNDGKSRLPRGQQQRVSAAYYPSPFQKHYDQLGE